MKIAMTGATGFLGTYAARVFVEEGHDVFSIQRSLIPDGQVHFGSPFVTQCIVDPKFETLVDLIDEIKPHVIVHIAAVLKGQEIESDIRAMMEANVLFPVLLARAAVTSGVKGLVLCGSSWQTSGPEVRFDPFNFYAATKQAAEDLVLPFCREGISCISLRLFDSYGPRDDRPKIVNLLMRAAEDGSSLKMSPGQQKMDLVYVRDTATALLRAAELTARVHSDVIQVAGVSSKRLVTLRALAGLIEEVSGKSLKIDWGARPYRSGEIMEPIRSLPDLPNWSAVTELERGLADTWNARRVHSNGR